jgi:hypothetical protein
MEGMADMEDMEISPGPEAEVSATPSYSADADMTEPQREVSTEFDDNSDGSASMSDSASEHDEDDYEPADVDMSQAMQQSDQDSDGYDPEEVSPRESAPTDGIHHDDLEDAYEPSENVDFIDTAPNTAPETPANIEDVDVGDNYAEASPLPENTESNEPQGISAVPMESQQDDVEQGPQLTEANTLIKVPDSQKEDTSYRPVLGEGSEPVTHYVPYKTPLSAFKNYRFHTDFNDTVKAGYRSLTYSNSIDPSRPLCPTELSGRPCTDPTCEEQHFRQLGLSGM